MIVFPKQNFNKGEYVDVMITDCTTATLIGKATKK
jgi:tRNA-2-methylthio-N6-dimethylallyladenosine synthase